MASVETIGVGVIGVGGYGRQHLASIAVAQTRGLCRLNAAVVLPGLEQETEAGLRSQSVRIYRSHARMLEAEKVGAEGVDLVGVPCGIPEHATLSVDSLHAGRHVLCEKPAAGSLAEARRMQRAAVETGNILSIGYQNMYTPSIRRIKELVLQGWRGEGLGRLASARSAAVWPRDSTYYGRNAWAGRLTADGVVVNDSPVQNALAHELQNLLYVAGPSPDQSATPVGLYGEQYRAKEIESADTQYLRVRTAEGPVLTFMATHACLGTWGPLETYVFERGRVTWNGQAKGHTVIVAQDEPEVVLDNGSDDILTLPYLRVLEALRDGRNPAATIHNTIQHCVCVDALFRFCPIVPVQPGHLRTQSGKTVVTSIVGVEELMAGMYDTGQSFHEAGAAWAHRGTEVSI